MDMTFGCDPELIFFSKDKQYIAPLRAVRSTRYYEPPDSYHFEEGGVELHPNPVTHPKDGPTSISEALKDVRKALVSSKIKIGATAFNYLGRSNGGHIHIRTDLLSRAADIYKVCNGIAYLTILGNKDSCYRRLDTYGGVFSYRTPIGVLPGIVNYTRNTRNTWEFRSPTPDWLAYPELIVATYKFVQELVKKATKVQNIMFYAVSPTGDTLYESELVSTKHFADMKDFIRKNGYTDLRNFLKTDIGITQELLDTFDSYAKRLRRQRAARGYPVVEVRV